MNDPEGLNAYVDQGSIDDRGFEGGVGNWVPLGDDADAVAQSPDQAKIGTYSLKLTSGTGAAHTQWAGWTTALSGFVQNDVVYYQTYIYLGAAWPHGVEVIIQERTSGGAWLKDHAIETIVATGAWVRVSGSITVAEATAAKLRFLIGSSIDDFSGGAVSVYIDEVYLIHDTLINFGFSESDAGGGDKNNDLVLIESLLGGNMSEFVLENISDVDGYVMPLKVRGRTVRRYDPVMQYAENGVSIDDHYKRIQTLQLKYQDDPLVGQDWANKVLSDRELPETILESCLVHATKSAGNLAAILDLEPGERIEISESVAAIDDEYFI
ncbi:MAG: carbohydrate binding domain-containing protein, partial [Candidatus Hydrogenedentes bacterium]|nr:carbohydrate binding domain-containing protein [Candidatus Hydrogenedentota bacterium]